jgi:hypothetical protein
MAEPIKTGTARKQAAKKAKPTSAPAPRKSRSATAAKAPARVTAMSAEHKQALAVGREEGRAVRNYLEALEAHKPKRGRKRTAASIHKRLEQIELDLPYSDPLTRVHLAQEQLDLRAEMEAQTTAFDIASLEEAFINAAGGYSGRKGISYTAWREVGVSADVLRQAGIARTRSSS